MPAAPKLDRHQTQLKRVRRLCAEFPGSTEKPSHGTPTFFAGKVYATFADNVHGDGRLALWVPAGAGEQEALVEEDPETYFRPPYVGCKGWVGIDLRAVSDEVLAVHLRRAWQLTTASKSAARQRPVATGFAPDSDF